MSNGSNWGQRLGLGAVALVIVGGLVWTVLRSGPLAPVKVTVAKVQTGVVNPAVMGIGTVEARRTWMVGPTATGRVLQVRVDVGDTVQAGQLLAEMDPVDLDQRLAALDATLARARSGQQTATAQLADARARDALSAANLRRNQDLARQSFISAGALEVREQERASTQAGVQAAQAGLSGAAQDLQRLQAERAALAQQRGNLRLLAPAAGVITTREAEAGTTVVAGAAVLRLVDPASLWVKTRLDQGRAAGLAVGQTAQVVLRSQPAQTHAATVARLELLADAVTEERLAQVAFAQLVQGASVGEMAEVTVALAPSTSGLVLPNAALRHQAGQAGVLRLLESGQAEWVPVRVVSSGLQGQLRVDAPADAAPNTLTLAEGDRVVVHSQKAVQPGSRLQVVDALVKPAAGNAGAGA